MYKIMLAHFRNIVACWETSAVFWFCKLQSESPTSLRHFSCW